MCLMPFRIFHDVCWKSCEVHVAQALVAPIEEWPDLPEGQLYAGEMIREL